MLKKMFFYGAIKDFKTIIWGSIFLVMLYCLEMCMLDSLLCQGNLVGSYLDIYGTNFEVLFLCKTVHLVLEASTRRRRRNKHIK
uniref:Putative ovule protein n=1 Tax=Solanum chacoense TaxID=4108 RepID=A0A0V0HF45_SOLCH